MQVLFDGQVHVHYGQMYVESDLDRFGADLAAAFTGQTNGLCGAAIPGFLLLITGLHTGNVGATIELHDVAPALDEVWEEIVEVSFRPQSGHVFLVEWGGGASWPLHLQTINYRIRLSASGMQQAQAEDTRMDGEPQLDQYLLQFWPAQTGPDQILKQTTESAAYWHSFASGLPQRRAAAE